MECTGGEEDSGGARIHWSQGRTDGGGVAAEEIWQPFEVEMNRAEDLERMGEGRGTYRLLLTEAGNYG